MKAFVLFKNGGAPKLVDNYTEPAVASENQALITVKAAALKHLDRSTAGGTHYSSEADIATARIIGMDGVGTLPDGSTVFAIGVRGMMAEKAVIEKSRMVKLPENIDPAIAAALPNAVAGSAMALRYRAKMKGGETVLINGATGFTGRIALQVARLYGAKKIIVTGRNEASLRELVELGVDEVVSLKQDDQHFSSRIKSIHAATPIDIVIDYVWGHSAELILGSLKGDGHFTHCTRYVSIGSMAGDSIRLSSEILRSVDLHLTGSGLGSWTREEMKMLLTDILPGMFRLAADGKLNVGVQTIAFDEVEHAWDLEMDAGKRLVVLM